MKNNKKIFAFDADGTLLTDKGEILNETIEALKKVKKSGHIIMVATGRPLIFIKNIKKIEIFDYLICNNGTYYLKQKTGEKCIENVLPKKIILKMIKIAKQNESIILVSDVDNVLCTIFGQNKEIESEFKKQWQEKAKIVSSQYIIKHINKHSATQSSILSTSKKIEIMEKELKINNNEVEIKIANWKYLDANPKNVSKYASIKKIAQKININNDSIIAFGDSGNDIEMLKEAAIGIAMENGTKESKAVANEVIGNNNSPAIANKLLEIIK